MVAVAGVSYVLAEKRADAVSAMIVVQTATRDEAGCRTYTFYNDLEDETTFHVFEEWDTEEQLKAHLDTPHIATFRQAAANFRDTNRPSQVTVYYVESTRPL